MNEVVTQTAQTPQEAHLPKFGGLLKASFREFKARKSRIWKILLYPWLFIVPVFVLGLILTFVTKAAAVLLGLAGVLSFAGTFLGIIAITLDFVSPVSLDSMKKLYREALRRLGRYFHVLVLAILSVMGGMLLLFVPGIILSFRTTFWQFTLLGEEKRGFDALGESWRLVKGNTGELVMRTICLGFLIFAVLLPFIILSAVFAPPDKNTFDPFGFIIQIINIFVVTPVSILFSLEMYKSLKKQKGEATQEIMEKAKKSIRNYMMIGVVAVILGLLAGVFVAVKFIRIGAVSSSLGSMGSNEYAVQFVEKIMGR